MEKIENLIAEIEKAHHEVINVLLQILRIFYCKSWEFDSFFVNLPL